MAMDDPCGLVLLGRKLNQTKNPYLNGEEAPKEQEVSLRQAAEERVM